LGAGSTTSPGEAKAPIIEGLEGRRHEVLGIVTGALTVLFVLALASYDARGGEDWAGPVGEALASVLAHAFGIAACVLPVELGLATLRFFRRSRTLLGLATLASTLVIVLTGCAMLHLACAGETVFGGHLAGGALGEVLGEVLRSLLGLAGAYVVGIAVLLVTMVLRTSLSIVEMAGQSASLAKTGAERAREWLRALVEAWREARALEAAEREAKERETAPRIVAGGVEVEDDDDPVIDDSDETAAGAALDLAPDDSVELEDDEDEPDEPAAAEVTIAGLAEAEAAAKKRKKKKGDGPRIVAPAPKDKKSLEAALDTLAGIEARPSAPGTPFVLPPTTLLDEAAAADLRIDAHTLRDNAARLVEKLEAYGVRGRVDEIHPGPVVTMYEFEPESGTKVSKIAGLADDLAMALAAQKVRIVAPIPGKARVGFELPNEERKTVHLREILEDERWDRYKASLPIALGQDIAGQPVYGDLAKMPHLLVAGATGSGKSVGLNVMLVSLLAKRSPEELRFLMIDPKVVELAVFDKIPHMLLPVVTDMKKAALALRWAVDEMERRYQLFADAGARNVTTYNQRVQRVLDGEMAPEKLAPNRAVDETGAQPPAPQKLPYVVVVVDEFADLMMVAAKDVEAAIARLAQKARAAGIHVILATQRPSVDVITGMIKANFPARMGFKVSQREDSKTILGRTGAEHLLGMGDMLMIPPGSSDLMRVHSAFISEDEVKAVCDFVRAQGKPIYDEEILRPRDDENDLGFDGPKTDDPLYDKAVAVVATAGYCSISHIQRQLGVGYNKAAKLVEQMEREGVVGPPSGKAGGRREVLVQAL
jgi:S-DNA-T family DNA segregation ATPase FtsK/SpoIIIE